MSIDDKEPDWKAIAASLYEGLRAAINYGKFSNTSMMLNMETGEATGIYGYMADRLEKMPGTRVDRELLGLNQKQIAKIRKERSLRSEK